MNRTSLSLVIPLILLAALATTPVTVIEDAFARYQRHSGSDLSQAASISNSCLNPVSNSNTNNNMISNGNCGGTISQQGKSGQASTPTTVQNANPTIEVQRGTGTSPEWGLGGGPPDINACDECFSPNGDFIFQSNIQYDTFFQSFNALAGLNTRPVHTIHDLCTYISILGVVIGPDAQRQTIGHVSDALRITFGSQSQIPTEVMRCLLNAFNITT
jgi:hypothetical protein